MPACRGSTQRRYFRQLFTVAEARAQLAFWRYHMVGAVHVTLAASFLWADELTEWELWERLCTQSV